MFFFLSKLLPTLIYPLGFASVLLVLITFSKKPRLRKRMLWLAIAVLWIGGNKWVSSALARSLEWQYLPPIETPRAQAIVILGGGLNPAAFPRQMVEVDDAGDRVIYGAKLYRDGAAPLVVVTAGVLPWSNSEASGATNMTEMLAFLGVPEDAVVLEEQSVNTYENALYTRRLLEERGINQIILVTSAFHMPRSIALFEKQGFDVIPAATDFSVTRSSVALPFSQAWPDYLIGVFPNADNMARTSKMMKEYIGIWIYGLRGWL